MKIDEFWETFDAIESVTETPAGILVHLKKDDPVAIESNQFVDKAIQNGTELELVLTGEGIAQKQELLKQWRPKKKLTFKNFLMNVMDVLSGSLVPLMPMLIAAALFKTLASVLGPDMLNVLRADSDLYTLFTFVGDAGFYFFPLAVGYTSAGVLHVTPMLGLFLGAILIHPTLVNLASAGNPFSVYGIRITPLNYASTILPVILSVWFMSYVEKFLKRVIPDALKDVFVPFLSVAITLPVMLCVLAPAGSVIGEGLCNLLISLGNVGGIVTVLTIAVLGMLWEFIIMGGLHWLFISSVYVILASNGQETIITPMCVAAAFATGGMAIGMALCLKNPRERSSAISCAVAQMVGGVTEPALYGVGFKYKKPFIGLMAGAFTGSLYAGITRLIAYNFIPSASFLGFLNYVGGSTMNLINSIISAVIGFAVSVAVTYITCRTTVK